MAIPSQEQVSAAVRAQLESQVELWAKVNTQALDRLQTLFALNMNAAKRSVALSADGAQWLLSPGKNPAQAWLDARPQVEAGTTLDYGMQATRIAFGAGIEFAQMVRQQVEETAREISVLLGRQEDAFGGSAATLEFMRRAIDDVGSQCAQWTNAVAQAASAEPARKPRQTASRAQKTGRTKKIGK